MKQNDHKIPGARIYFLNDPKIVLEILDETFLCRVISNPNLIYTFKVGKVARWELTTAPCFKILPGQDSPKEEYDYKS